MITKFKYSLLLVVISICACRDESKLWKIPIGYKKYKISLGDSYEEISEKLGKLKLDVNADNGDDFKNYLKIPEPNLIEQVQLNPIIFMRSNRNELVWFEIIYTIDEKERQLDFDELIKYLGKNELNEIDELINKKRKSIISNSELWIRKIDVDTISGQYPKIKYRVQAIP